MWHKSNYNMWTLYWNTFVSSQAPYKKKKGRHNMNYLTILLLVIMKVHLWKLAHWMSCWLFVCLKEMEIEFCTRKTSVKDCKNVSELVVSVSSL